MSINNKLRTLARLLPYFPRINSKGEYVVSYQFIMGADMLAKNPEAKDKNGNPIMATTRYKQPIVICADHFEELRKAYKISGEEGVRAYNDKVKAYQTQKNKTDHQPILKKV